MAKGLALTMTETFPENPEAWAMLSILAAGLGDAELGQSALEKALEIDPQEPTPAPLHSTCLRLRVFHANPALYGPCPFSLLFSKIGDLSQPSLECAPQAFLKAIMIIMLIILRK